MTDIKPLSERVKLIQRKQIGDERGWFLKIITGKENDLPNYTGEIYAVYAVAGQSRGGHYHKKASEWFTLLVGKSILHLEDISSNETLKIDLDAKQPFTVFVPPNIAHRFENTGDDPLILIAYTDELYDSTDTISYY